MGNQPPRWLRESHIPQKSSEYIRWTLWYADKDGPKDASIGLPGPHFLVVRAKVTKKYNFDSQNTREILETLGMQTCMQKQCLCQTETMINKLRINFLFFRKIKHSKNSKLTNYSNHKENDYTIFLFKGWHQISCNLKQLQKPLTSRRKFPVHDREAMGMKTQALN